MFRELLILAFLPILIVLTATAPNWIVDELKSCFGCIRKPVIIRQPTRHLNIAYSVHSDAQNVSGVGEQIADVIVSYAADDRCIVYVTALNICDTTCQASLRWPRCHMRHIHWSARQGSKHLQISIVEGWPGKGHDWYKCLWPRG